MSDFPHKTPDQHRELIRNALLEELRRAQMQDYVLADKFLEGDPATVNWFQDALRSGDPDVDPETLSEDFRVLRERQLAGFAGRGWDEERVRQWKLKNGPTIPPRLLTEGGRQANDWKANRELIEGYLKARSPEAQPKSSLKNLMLAPTSWSNVDDNGKRDYENALSALAEEYQRKHGSEYGESGWAGFMENPGEYTLPWITDNFFDRGYQAINFGLWNEQSDGKSRGLLGSLLDSDTYLQMRRTAGQIEPPIPGNPKTPAERESQFKSMKEMLTDTNPRDRDGVTAYENQYRRNEGYYPSYLGSTMTELAQNLFSDPSILVTGGMSGAGALKIATRPAMKTIRGVPIRWYHALHPLGNEAREEATMYGAMAGPMTAYNESEQANFPEEHRRPIPWKNLYMPGNDARTDIPKEIREMPQKQWIDRDAENQKKREKALQEWPKVWDSLPSKQPLGALKVQPAF